MRLKKLCRLHVERRFAATAVIDSFFITLCIEHKVPSGESIPLRVHSIASDASIFLANALDAPFGTAPGLG
jgi:hypothetical protein